MGQPAIITAAICGAETTRAMTPHLPISPRELGEEGHDIDGGDRRTDARGPADPLIYARGSPRQVEMNDRGDTGEREPFAQHVGRDEQAHDVTSAAAAG